MYIKEGLQEKLKEKLFVRLRFQWNSLTKEFSIAKVK